MDGQYMAMTCGGMRRIKLLFNRARLCWCLSKTRRAKRGKTDSESDMKTKLICFVIVLALFAGLDQTARAAVTFTNTPTIISNTYSGTISLQIGSLTNGETVVVQKFLDANTNGVIDAGDILWQQFNLTDGTNFVIGGVTNFYVPGDLNSTTGAITAALNFQADFSQTIVGKYLFKLSSPSGRFAPMTNSFTVTNFPYAQKFTGTVVSNGVAVPDAAVLLFQSTGGNNMNPVGGAMADNSGAYIIQAPAGTYSLAAFKSNFVADVTMAANLGLGGGATLNTNLSLIAATQNISGKIEDASSSIGLPALLVPVQTKNGLLAVCFTDTNGNFNAGVNANQWGVGGDSSTLAICGYVGLQNKTTIDTTTGSVSGVTIALPKATAFVYGTLKDNFGNPLPGVFPIEAYDNNNKIYQSDGYTDTNGYYVTGVVGGLGNSDPWWVDVDNKGSYPDYIFSQAAFDQNGGTNIGAGQAVLANLTAILATNHITGHVKFNGTNVIGVGVNANAMINGLNYQVQVDTDTNGNYSLNVADGDWNVGVFDCCDNDSLENILGSGNYQTPDDQNIDIDNNNATNDFIVQSAGSGPYQITGQITGNNGNPIAGVNVYASDGNGNFFTTTTDGDGNYSLNNIGNGNLTVSVDCGNLASLGYDCVNSQETNILNNSDYGLNFIVKLNQPVLGPSTKYSGTQFQFSLFGASNQNYTIQYSTNLGSTNWMALFVTNSATTNSFLLTDPNATNRQRFYRALIGP
jgi:hypothetical protein